MEQPIPFQSRRSTVAEYLRLEEDSSARHEFRNGQITRKIPDSATHDDIAAHIFFNLKAELADSALKLVISNVRVRVGANNHYWYPDLMIYRRPAAFDSPGRRTTITNPQIVLEIVSPLTGDDRNGKLYDYVSIDSLQEYILVDQERARIDTFYRHADGIWAIGPSSDGLETALKLRSLNITIPLAEIYAGVELPYPPREVSNSA